MAKDPAMLWYWNDWHGGTSTFPRHLKGCYMDLLHAQFNSGHLSLEEIKTVLGNDFAAWGTLSKKFAVDETGKYFNERMDSEIIKRRAYSESRRKNRLNKDMSIHMNNHMSGHMDNENENRNETGFKERGTGKTIKGFGSMPKAEDVADLPEVKITASIELLRLTKKQVITPAQVRDMWEVFKVQNLTGKKYYSDVGDVYSHFINWIKTQNFIDGNNGKQSTGKNIGKSAGAESLLERAKQKFAAGGT